MTHDAQVANVLEREDRWRWVKPVGCLTFAAGAVALWLWLDYFFSEPMPVGSGACDEFAFGRIDPESIERIEVYRYPKGVRSANDWRKLRSYPKHIVRDREEIRQFIELLARTSYDGTDGDPYKSQNGAVLAFLKDGELVFFHFCLWPDRIWVSPPTYPGEFGTHGHSEEWIKPMLERWVRQAR